MQMWIFKFEVSAMKRRVWNVLLRVFAFWACGSRIQCVTLEELKIKSGFATAGVLTVKLAVSCI
jgi:hypothetical protein